MSSRFFSLQGRALKEIHAILIETLGEHAQLYATVKNWVAQFKDGDFSICDAPRPGRPKTVTTPEIIEQIHELILEDRRISTKSIAEQLGSSRERVGSIIHEDLDTRKLSAKWVPKCLNADQKHQRRQSSETGIFLARSKWFPLGRDWWPWTKPGYSTMSRRQSNSQWSGGIEAHPAPPPKIPRTKIRWKSPGHDFLGSRRYPPHWLSSKGPNYQRGVLLISAGAFWIKTLREGHQGGLVLAQCPGSPGTCNPEESGLPGLPVSWSPILFFGNGPVGLPPVPWTEKQLNGYHFLSDAEVIAARRPGWTDSLLIFFLSGLQ